MIGSDSWEQSGRRTPQLIRNALERGWRLLGRLRHVLHGEPLIGFALAGGLIFLLYAVLAEPEREPIIISPEVLEEMVSLRREILGRPLDHTERAQLIDERLLDEILVREAVLRDLHLSDSYVRRRLVTRMKLLLDEAAPPPSAEDLAALLAAEPVRFLTPRAASFDQVFFQRDEAAARAMLPRLRQGGSAFQGKGETFWVGQEFDRYTDEQTVAVFGREFLVELATLPAGEWAGPIHSRRGWHLVRLRELHPPVPLPELLMQQTLREEWAQRHWIASRQRQLDALRVHYDVVLPNDG